MRKAVYRRFLQLLPGPQVRNGAAWGIIALILLISLLMGIFIRPGLPGLLDEITGVIFFLVTAGLFALAFYLGTRLIMLLPRFLNPLGMAALAAFIFLFREMGRFHSSIWLLALGLGAAAAWMGSGIAHLFHPDYRFARRGKKIYVCLSLVLPAALFLYCVFWLADRGSTEHLVEVPAAAQEIPALAAPNPGRPGGYQVLTLTYGSGHDKRRREYGPDADLTTEPVDATPFIKNNKGWKVKFRKWYWGFGFEEFPVNGRVWYPQGNGPFPLVLIVHGNHKMQEFSDPGYAYLGELLASRGFILVSVDENFFNGAFMSSLSQENDGRGWMLLQHLKVWRDWNRNPGNPFFGKVDMDHIGLIGHSRGGEAAAVAGAFNRLAYYPEDATIAFDFQFNIKAIVAIAPSDGQYKPAQQPTPLENVNYLVLQGAHDADVSVFAGIRQYQRVRFTDGGYWFKASLYAYRANHGQFNTVWGDSDWGKPMGVVLNRRALLSGEEQRTIARVYISAFLEAALHGDAAYIPLFRDYRVVRDWLPEDIYVNRFQDTGFSPVCHFEEDVDVTTASREGIRVHGENLAVWREADLGFRRGGTKENNVVFLGWRGPEDERQESRAPYYVLDFPEGMAADIDISPSSSLMFTLAEADEEIPEPDDEPESDAEVRKNKEAFPEKSRRKSEEEKGKPLLQLSVELEDANGIRARLPLDRFRNIPPVMKSRFTKVKNEGKAYGQAYEPTLQTFELPLRRFLDARPELEPEILSKVRFVFDRGREGIVILDNIGFSSIVRKRN